MKTILCYGDSNTWGYTPGTAVRYPADVRWPGVLRAALGEGFHVLEEGLNARTTVLDDPTKVGRNGLPYFRPCLDSHAPLDLVVVMLGTNDLKHRFGLSAADIAQNVATLLAVVPTAACGPAGTTPPVLLICPPALGPFSNLSFIFDGAEAKSRDLARHYRAAADLAKVHFLDAGAVLTVSAADGVHFDPDGHARLGRAVAEQARRILG